MKAVTERVLEVAQTLIRFPSVSTPEPRWTALKAIVGWCADYLKSHGLQVHRLEKGPFPALWCFFPGQERAQVAWLGHLDVVKPEPDDRQFEPRIEGDYLWGRGAADMKTAVATVMVWMADRARQGPPYPPFSLMLITNEEEGETQVDNTITALQWYQQRVGALPALYIAGERTEETGTRPWGDVCVQSRGVTRFQVVWKGQSMHSGSSNSAQDLSLSLCSFMEKVSSLARRHLTLEAPDGWHSQIRFPFVQVGEQGVYNITPVRGILGVELRTIPRDSAHSFMEAVKTLVTHDNVDMQLESITEGTEADLDNPYLQLLMDSLTQAWGRRPGVCRKTQASSIRFVPRGKGILWGQSGIGPHSAEERHYIPSIDPYYRGLSVYAQQLLTFEGSE